MEECMKKEIERIIKEIKDIGKLPSLKAQGQKDELNTQIFTPSFIVEEMINLVGKEYVCDFSKTVLEPASGDGAFTTSILKSRLKSITKDDNFCHKSLLALATIYSLEIDEELVVEQRNNIFSVLCHYAARHNASLEYYNLAKLIIAHNIIWAKTEINDNQFGDSDAPDFGTYLSDKIGSKSSTDNDVKTFDILAPIVARYMPEGEKPIKFAVWSINPDLTYTYRLEDVNT